MGTTAGLTLVLTLYLLQLVELPAGLMMLFCFKALAPTAGLQITLSTTVRGIPALQSCHTPESFIVQLSSRASGRRQNFSLRKVSSLYAAYTAVLDYIQTVQLGLAGNSVADYYRKKSNCN